jgi:hypothetical protein
MKPSKKEIARFQAKEQKQLQGREVNRVQDRKTGEWYDSKQAFDDMMKQPEIQAMLMRLTLR